MAIKSCEHRKIASKLPNPEDVLNGQVKKLDIKEKSAQYSFAIGLCYELADLSNKDEKLFDKGVDYFFDFIMANFEPELVIYSAKTVLSDHDIDIKSVNYKARRSLKNVIEVSSVLSLKPLHLHLFTNSDCFIPGGVFLLNYQKKRLTFTPKEPIIHNINTKT